MGRRGGGWRAPGAWGPIAAIAGSLLLPAALAVRRRLSASRRRVKELQDALEHEKRKRQADRTGRIKAEKQLKELRSLGAQTTRPAGASKGEGGPPGIQKLDAAPIRMHPIGVLRSCFTQRNGTPRQPLLVPLARAELQLAPGVPPDCLEGLEQYSHCWVLYIFHRNTDLHQAGLGEAGATAATHRVKGKIRVPRLDGGRMGVLATRTPHRPNPIGLSVAEVISVSGGRLVLGGADIVDGSPVLDIKPYVPFCDGCPQAKAPPWVQAHAEDEPLQIDQVIISPDADSSLADAWAAAGRRSLYTSAKDFSMFVRQVLSRDIRSVHQRTQAGASGNRFYHVVLDQVDVCYTVRAGGSGVQVEVVSAAAAAAEGGGRGNGPRQEAESTSGSQEQTQGGTQWQLK